MYQAPAARVAAQDIGQRRDGVHAVVVARAAEVGQAAGQRQRARVARPDSKCVPGVEHDHREATVKVQMGDAGAVGIRALHCPVQGPLQGQGVAQPRAFPQGELLGFRVPVEVYPAVSGHAQLARPARRGDQHGRGLVHAVLGHEADRVRRHQRRIVRPGRDQFDGVERVRELGIRVAGGHLRERGEQLAHCPGVCLGAHPERGSARRFHQSVELHRRHELVSERLPADQLQGFVASAVMAGATGRLGPIQCLAGAPRCLDIGDDFHAEQQRHAGLAPVAAGRELCDQLLRRLAAKPVVDHFAGVQVQAPRDRPRQLAGPVEGALASRQAVLERTHGRDRIDRVADVHTVAVGQRPFDGERRQARVGRRPAQVVRHRLHGLADTDQYRLLVRRVHRWLSTSRSDGPMVFENLATWDSDFLRSECENIRGHS